MVWSLSSSRRGRRESCSGLPELRRWRKRKSPRKRVASIKLTRSVSPMTFMRLGASSPEGGFKFK